jgi:hypothetical protein
MAHLRMHSHGAAAPSCPDPWPQSRRCTAQEDSADLISASSSCPGPLQDTVMQALSSNTSCVHGAT